MSLAASILKTAYAVNPYLQKIADNEHYNVAPGVLGVMLSPSQSGLVLNDSVRRAIETSWGDGAKVVKYVTPTPTLQNTRSFTITHTGDTSSITTLTFGYLSFGIKQNPASFLNVGGELNTQTKAGDMERQMRAGINAMITELESLGVTALTNAKTTINNMGKYPLTGGSVVVSYAERKSVIADIAPMLMANNYEFMDTVDVVADAGAVSIVQEIQENGLNNAYNEALRLLNKDFYPSNAITAPAGKAARMFVVPMGSIGLTSRIQPLNKVGYVTTDGWTFASGNGLGFGLPLDLEIYSRSVATDASAGTGNAADTASVVEETIIGADFVIVTQFEAGSATKPSPVIEILVNTAATDADTTAPVASLGSSTGLTEVVVSFTEAVSAEADGVPLIADLTSAQLIALFTTTFGGAAAITAAEASEDSTEITLTISETGLVTGNTIAIAAGKVYDAAGNANALTTIATVNAGGDGWE